MPAPCTHRVSTTSREEHVPTRLDPTRCLDCGTILATRDMRPTWEHLLERGGDPARIREEWGYREASAWLFSEHSPYRAGLLAGRLDRQDLKLQQEIDANTERIVELTHLVKWIGATAPETLPTPVWLRLPDSVRPMRLTYCAILGWLGLSLVNAIRRRGGDYEGIVRPTRQRTTPFAGYRHALATAWTDDTELGSGSLAPSGVETTHGLPGGVLFDAMSVSPSRSSSGNAQGEARVLARLAAQDAVNTARVGQRHLRDTKGELHCIQEGKAFLSHAQKELLRLVDVGEMHSIAVIKKDSIIPAIDPLRVREAFDRLRHRRPSLPGTPTTEHEARLYLREARDAVIDQLLAFEMIPPLEHHPRPSAASSKPPPTNPWAVPEGSS